LAQASSWGVREGVRGVYFCNNVMMKCQSPRKDAQKMTIISYKE